mmetsp:Transcript_7327/g.16024  ORF Transcript_7327/g.16024 Transcript_7327/m.16024 type:complete len:276 (+) Transcript_7327:2-829(+)
MLPLPAYRPRHHLQKFCVLVASRGLMIPLWVRRGTGEAGEWGRCSWGACRQRHLPAGCGQVPRCRPPGPILLVCLARGGGPSQAASCRGYMRGHLWLIFCHDRMALWAAAGPAGPRHDSASTTARRTSRALSSRALVNASASIGPGPRLPRANAETRRASRSRWLRPSAIRALASGPRLWRASKAASRTVALRSRKEATRCSTRGRAAWPSVASARRSSQPKSSGATARRPSRGSGNRGAAPPRHLARHVLLASMASLEMSGGWRLVASVLAAGL